MFQTNLNHWLQSFDHPAFARFMEIVSMMGTVYFLTLIAFVFIAGVDFRKGFLNMNIFMWAVLITLFLKQVIDYPRPLAIDPSLTNFGFSVGQSLQDLMPRSFFELFSEELLVEVRKEGAGRFGFPSGHTSLITALFIGFAILVRRKWYTILSIVLVMLTMLSRLYLAQHFLGDVLGGLILALTLIAVFYLIIKTIGINKASSVSNMQTLFFLSPVIAVLLSHYFSSFQTGSFLGLNLGFLFMLNVWGEPALTKSIVGRIFNVLIFFLFNFSGVFLLSRAGLDKNSILSAAVFTIVMFVSFCVTIILTKKFDLISFQKEVK